MLYKSPTVPRHDPFRLPTLSLSRLYSRFSKYVKPNSEILLMETSTSLDEGVTKHRTLLSKTDSQLGLEFILRWLGTAISRVVNLHVIEKSVIILPLT